jgi:hypothetical protein
VLYGLVAQWITRLTTDQKIPGSTPGKIVFLHSIFLLHGYIHLKTAKRFFLEMKQIFVS